MGGGGSKGPKYMDPIIVKANPVKTIDNNLIFEPYIDMNYNEYLGHYFIHYYDNYFFFLFLFSIIIISIFFISIFFLLSCSFKNKKK